jgi:hypothetical protein
MATDSPGVTVRFVSASGAGLSEGGQQVWLGEHAVKMRKGRVAFTGCRLIEILEQLQQEV